MSSLTGYNHLAWSVAKGLPLGWLTGVAGGSAEVQNTLSQAQYIPMCQGPVV